MVYCFLWWCKMGTKFVDATKMRSRVVAKVSSKANYFGYHISGQNNADAEYLAN